MHRGRFVSINGSFFGTLFDTSLKNQVFRSIGVEEVLRRILGKAIIFQLGYFKYVLIISQDVKQLSMRFEKSSMRMTRKLFYLLMHRMLSMLSTETRSSQTTEVPIFILQRFPSLYFLIVFSFLFLLDFVQIKVCFFVCFHLFK